MLFFSVFLVTAGRGHSRGYFNFLSTCYYHTLDIHLSLSELQQPSSFFRNHISHIPKV